MSRTWPIFSLLCGWKITNVPKACLQLWFMIRNAKWCQSLQCWRDFLSFDAKHLIPTHIFYPSRFSKIINNDNEASRVILIMFIMMMMMTLIILSRKCSMTTFIHIWYKFPAISLALSVFKVIFHSQSIPMVDLVLETLKKADHKYLSILDPESRWVLPKFEMCIFKHFVIQIHVEEK